MKLKPMLENLRSALRRSWKFVSEDVWDVELSSLNSLHATGVKAVRVVCLVFRGFREDECPLHASSLTFSSLMAIVPVLAISLALARGFGADDAAKDWIRGRINDWTHTFRSAPAVPGEHGVTGETHTADVVAGGAGAGDLAGQINRLLEESFEKVENISFGKLGGVSLVLLLWMVIQVLGRVESSFNRVWGISTGRSTWRCFTDYLSVLLILPLLIVAAASLPALDLATRFLNPASAEVVRTITGSGLFKSLTVLMMTALSFTFLLMFMPNTRVRFWAGLSGGFVSGVLFLVWLWICAALQVGAARYGRIYGSFAIVPILLAWVYMSWQIVLFGAEVTFAVQNCSTYRMEQGARHANVQARLGLALTILCEAARSMVDNTKGGGFSAVAFASENRVSVRFLNDVIDELIRSRYIGRLSADDERYVLLKMPSSVPVASVVQSVLASGVSGKELGLQIRDSQILDAINSVSEGAHQSLQKMTLADLVKA